LAASFQRHADLRHESTYYPHPILPVAPHLDDVFSHLTGQAAGLRVSLSLEPCDKAARGTQIDGERVAWPKRKMLDLEAAAFQRRIEFARVPVRDAADELLVPAAPCDGAV